MSFLRVPFTFLLLSLLVPAAGCEDEVIGPGGGGAGAGAGGVGGDVGVAGDPQGAGGTGGQPIDPTGQPPPPPVGAQPGDGSAPVALAVRRLFVGTTTFQGQASADAWKRFGYDVDFADTASDFSTHCKPSGGAAPTNVFPDGDGGIDNAFGKVLIPIFKTAAATSGNFEELVQEPIASGDFTFIFELEDLGPGADYAPLGANYLEGREESGGTWLKAPESFSGREPLLRFPGGYLTDHTWVSTVGVGVLPIKLSMNGSSFAMRLRRPLVTAELDPAHGQASRGIISGVVDTEELIEELRGWLGNVDTAFCEGTAVEGILNQIRQASDIMNDGSQDPDATCNGISVGLGFTAEAVAIGALGPSEPPQPDPCGP